MSAFELPFLRVSIGLLFLAVVLIGLPPTSKDLYGESYSCKPAFLELGGGPSQHRARKFSVADARAASGDAGFGEEAAKIARIGAISKFDMWTFIAASDPCAGAARGQAQASAIFTAGAAGLLVYGFKRAFDAERRQKRGAPPLPSP